MTQIEWVEHLASFVAWFLELYLPPMIANSSPVLIRGTHPVDFGRNFVDGKRIFGSHKTWEGLLLGIVLGTLASLSTSMAFRDPSVALYGSIGALAALFGDLVGAFVKRRMDIRPGDPLPLVDQLDFALLATLAYYFIAPDKLLEHGPSYVVISLILIALLHVLTNNAAYMLKLKDKRW
ncbi:MAG: CDP-2,3-bis-(O-geranylgeranyl)-sn-glycerol synthase [Desulfurococcaceae archaeon]